MANDEAPMRALETFLEALRNLDWEPFRAAFADDATVFFPFADSPRRADGREQIEAGFSAFFDAVRRERPERPYLNIQPRDVRIERRGSLALVTFHLEPADRFGRRTLVLEEREGRWLVVHLHGSNIPWTTSAVPTAPRPG